MILTETQEKIQNTTDTTGIGEWQEKLDRKILVQKKCITNPAFSECAEVIQTKSFEKSR